MNPEPPVCFYCGACVSGKGKGLVFPAAAKMLAANPDGLTWRFKKIVARALGDDERALQAGPLTAAGTEDEGAAAICEHVAEGERRDRMLDMLHRYCAGQSIRVIEKETGTARTVASNDLRTVEGWTGKRFMQVVPHGTGAKAAIKRLTRVDRKKGQRAASVLDWHALRTTWVTMALRSGVPMDVLRRVTGHQTVETVLKHYDQRDREDFRAVLNGALPAVLTGGKVKRKPTAADELAALAGKVAAGTATAAEKKRLRVLAARV